MLSGKREVRGVGEGVQRVKERESVGFWPGLRGGEISLKVTTNQALQPLSQYNSCWKGNRGDIGKFVGKRFKGMENYIVF